MYQFSPDHGPDDLSDVTPLDGGVPIRHIPQPERLAELIGTPGGFEQWAVGLLTEFEHRTFYMRTVDQIMRHPTVVAALEIWDAANGDLNGQRRRAIAMLREILPVTQTAAVLGVSEATVYEICAPRNVSQIDALNKVEQLSAQGLPIALIVEQTGLSQRTVERHRAKCGLGRKRGNDAA